MSRASHLFGLAHPGCRLALAVGAALVTVATSAAALAQSSVHGTAAYGECRGRDCGDGRGKGDSSNHLTREERIARYCRVNHKKRCGEVCIEPDAVCCNFFNHHCPAGSVCTDDHKCRNPQLEREREARLKMQKQQQEALRRRQLELRAQQEAERQRTLEEQRNRQASELRRQREAAIHKRERESRRMFEQMRQSRQETRRREKRNLADVESSVRGASDIDTDGVGSSPDAPRLPDANLETAAPAPTDTWGEYRGRKKSTDASTQFGTRPAYRPCDFGNTLREAGSYCGLEAFECSAGVQVDIAYLETDREGMLTLRYCVPRSGDDSDAHLRCMNMLSQRQSQDLSAQARRACQIGGLEWMGHTPEQGSYYTTNQPVNWRQFSHVCMKTLAVRCTSPSP